MKLEDVRRSTPASKTIDALVDALACEEAISWAKDLVKHNPRLTAQGLWNACPWGEWLEWLVGMTIATNDVEDTATWDDIAGIDADICPYAYPSRPELGLKAARVIRRVYESPWLW